MAGVAAVMQCYSYAYSAAQATCLLPKRLPSSRSPPPFDRLPPKQIFHRPTHIPSPRICAIFWGPRKTIDSREMDLSLEEFVLTGSAPEEVSTSERRPQKVCLSVVSSISDISSEEWDACAVEATGLEKLNPFLTHAFLSSLEESGSSVKVMELILQKMRILEIVTDIPQALIFDEILASPVVAEQLHASNTVFLTGEAFTQAFHSIRHSYGEFVFDHSWADAYYSYGAQYYPKLQCCVPFTPVTGQRILIRDIWCKDQVFDKLVWALKYLTAKLQVSSVHVTFPSEIEWHQMREHGFLQRTGMQYHWKNRNYKNFDEFLMDMKQSKRKNIRQERKKIAAQNITMKRLRGDEIKARHWDSFYKFYRNTTDNKWGRAFLTRDFFHMMGEKMGDKVLLIVAEDGDELVAGALNLIGGDALFGRLWGCLPEAYYPSLHFEACYYQAIESAIELDLNTVEAGAQGEHKIQRGYLPVTTYSTHYIPDEGFRKAIQDFLVRERDQVKLVMQLLHDSSPFKDGIH